MFDIIVFIYMNSYFPPNSLSLFFTFPLKDQVKSMCMLKLRLKVCVSKAQVKSTCHHMFFNQTALHKIGKYMAKLTFLWYDNFGKKERSLHRNGMSAIPKMQTTFKKYKLDHFSATCVGYFDQLLVTRIKHFIYFSTVFLCFSTKQKDQGDQI